MQAVQAPEGTLEQQVGRIAGILSSERFPTGERAALRRMNPGHPLPLSFYRFAFSYLPPGWEKAIDDWTTLVAGIALMSPNAYSPQVGFGAALADAEYSESRLERLLAAEYEVRRTLFLRAIRFLAAKSKPFNWAEGARFLLTESKSKREMLNLSIARDFYRKADKE
ncbi:MAG TPA: type I-E CRISPR-associated protein Cse2/CasB [Bacillota bacterium]|nr:type I-E CRISPR-associated protein Cse2/CasB [Bacillota bacterium]